MKITVKNSSSERQSPEVTIDTSTCHYPYAIRDALWLALELDGYDKETMKSVFNMGQDERCEPPEPAAQEAEVHGHFTDWWLAINYFTNGNEDHIATLSQQWGKQEIIDKANELWEQQNK